jgi:hypothetical protein
MSKSNLFNTDAACDVCGKFGSFDFGDTNLCSDCYQQRGSCCVEFGGYDLWNDDKNQNEQEMKKNLKHTDNK